MQAGILIGPGGEYVQELECEPRFECVTLIRSIARALAEFVKAAVNQK
jgi:hypothetical protein